MSHGFTPTMCGFFSKEDTVSEGLNKVMLLGNLGADPELRMTAGGQALLKLRLATTESYVAAGDNVRQERTEWHSVTLWGKRGEALAKFLKKGDRIFVEGGLRTSSYEKDGEKRYRTEINATNVILSGSRGSSDAEPEPAQQSRRPPAQRGAPPPARAPAPVSNDYGDAYEGADDIPF